MANRLHLDSATKANPGDTLQVIHDFHARSPDELSLRRGEKIELIERDDDFGDGWYLGKHLQDGKTGLFPEVYTKLASQVRLNDGTRFNRSSSTPQSPSYAAMSPKPQPLEPEQPKPVAPAQSIAASTEDLGGKSDYYNDSPQPLQPTSTTSQRIVSAPASGLSTPAMSSNPPTQRSISLMMEKSRAHGEDSPVINETLSVIDEHITDMNTPRSSLMAADLRGLNDSGSDYSGHLDHRLSYIQGHETDEEERDDFTSDEVMRWSPKQVADALLEIGVERRHCDIFKEQEISGEILLTIDQATLFMKEFDLGVVGRRLRTWNKIKSFQEGLKSRSSSGAGTRPNYIDTGSIDGSKRSISQPGSAGLLPKISELDNRDSLKPQKQDPVSHPDTKDDGNSRSATPGTPSIPRIVPSDSPGRPSAASVRDFNHSRRHSSIDFNSKSDAASFGGVSKNSTPPTSPALSHKKQPSFDRNWTMSLFPSSTNNRASAALGLSALGMAGHALSKTAERSALDTNSVSYASVSEATKEPDQGYTSSGELDNRKTRSVLRKANPASAGHSRQSSYKDEPKGNAIVNLPKRHSRFGSAGSIRETITSITTSSPKIGSGDGSLKGRSRTVSLRDKDSPTDPSLETVTRITSKVNHTESPISVTSPHLASESPTSTSKVGQAASKTGPSGSEQDAKSSFERSETAPLQSPARSASAATSEAWQSLDTDSMDNSAKSASQRSSVPTPTASSRRAKSKKDTSAYQKGLLKVSPRDAMKDCDYSGWMKKKSPKVTSTWKPRLFVLRGRRLGYYYSEDDTTEKGVIDITSHRVLPADNDFLTGLHATLTGAKSSPTSPANAQTVTTNATEVAAQIGEHSGNEESMFIFKLVPPRAGFSRAISFTKQMVHYFAVDNVKQGRLWMAALMKATIDRDESKPVSTTFSQKTISLSKAISMKHRPPALMGATDEHTTGDEKKTIFRKSASVKTDREKAENDNESGLNIQGLNLSYEHIDSAADKETSENGTSESQIHAPPGSAPLLGGNDEHRRHSDVEQQHAQNDNEEANEHTNGNGVVKSKSGNSSGWPSLRLVRSLSSELRPGQQHQQPPQQSQQSQPKPRDNAANPEAPVRPISSLSGANRSERSASTSFNTASEPVGGKDVPPTPAPVESDIETQAIETTNHEESNEKGTTIVEPLTADTA